MQGLPHAPCRLQRDLIISSSSSDLCLHTPRADCNSCFDVDRFPIHSLPPHAPCRLQHWRRQIRTVRIALCLHTPRADCNCGLVTGRTLPCSLPPHAPCRLQRQHYDRTRYHLLFASTRSVQIATRKAVSMLCFLRFASTRSVQIATGLCADCHQKRALCLHTLRADCNNPNNRRALHPCTLPPHAPCRLQLQNFINQFCRCLCLHTLRADCNWATW